MQRKCVTFCFIKLNTNRFLQNHRGKGYWKNSRKIKHEIVTRKIDGGVASQIAEQSKDWESWKMRKFVYFNFHWLNKFLNSWIWIRNSWIWTLNSSSWTCNLGIWTRGFELVNRGFELLNRGFELVNRGFELVNRGFELPL